MKRNLSFYISLLAISVVATWIAIHNYPVVDRDAVLYLSTASIDQEFGLHAALQSYSWPFYSVLIALVSSFLHISILSAAHVLTFIFSASIFLAVATLVQRLGGTRREQWIGILLLLCYHEIILFFQTFIRDFGYWACTLWALIVLIQFFKTSERKYLLVWATLSGIATLFRIEGAFILFCMPFLVMIFHRRPLVEKWLDFLCLNWFTVVGLFWFMTHPHSMGRAQAFTQDTQHASSTTHDFIVVKAQLIQPLIFPRADLSDVSLLLIFGTFCMIIFTFISAFSWPNALLLLYGCVRKTLRIPTNIRFIFWSYCLLNVAIIIAGTMTSNLFVPRYDWCLCLILLPLLAHVLSEAYQRWKTQRHAVWWKKYGFPLFILWLISGIFATLLHMGPSKAYLRTGAHWLNAQHAQHVYTNSGRLSVYLQGPNNGWYCQILYAPPGKPALCFNQHPINTQEWRDFDWLAIDVNDAPPEQIAALKTLLHRTPDKIFYGNRHHDQLIIYRINK